MKPALVVLTIAVVYILHQDWWNWTAAHPLAFGFLPIGLWYHALYTIAAAFLMAALVRWCWPKGLERDE
jgi:hypothetical protein